MAGTSDGYERLLDGPGAEDGAPFAAAQPQSACAYQPLLGGDQQPFKPGASAGAVRVYNLTVMAAGTPAPAGAAAGAAAAAAEQGKAAALGEPLDSLPDVAGELQKASNLVCLWLGMALTKLLLKSLESSLGTLAALVGILGAAIHFFNCHTGAPLPEAIKAMHWLAVGAAALSAGASVDIAARGVSLASSCGGPGQSEDDATLCSVLIELLCFRMLWFTIYSGLSACVARAAARHRRLLDPVTSGAVAV